MAHNDCPDNVDLGHPTGRRLQYALMRLLIRLLFRLSIIGLEHVPAAGPVIIIINHIAFLDPVMVCGSFPRRVIPLAKAEAYQSLAWGWLTKIYGTIPVHRGEADMNAIKLALRILRQGGVILMAPEGTRSPAYQLQTVKDGAAILAWRSGAQLLPIGVTGTHRVKAHWLKLKRAPVHLSIGQPFCLQSPGGHNRVSREEMSAMTKQMMYRLAAQLPPEFRGVYSNIKNAKEICPLFADK